jgi:hypothetical protein
VRAAVCFVVVQFSGGAIAVLGMVAVGAAETRNLNMSGF